jgi:hypothetical protein
MTLLHRSCLTGALAMTVACSAEPRAVVAPTTEAPAGSRPAAVAEAGAPRVPHPSNQMPFEASETWSGTYVCAQGLTQAELTLVRVHGDQFEALFSFHHDPTGISGEYEMTGLYTAETRNVHLTAGDWVTQPPNYVTVNFDGRIAPDESSFSGRVIGPGCSSFTLRRNR